MPTFQDLPLDVIDRVLTLLQDFDTLAVALKTCKRVYDVFQGHPKSIVREVAMNVTGPLLPEALRLYRLVDGVQEDEKDVLEDPDLTREEATGISEHARVMRELEDLYSMRCVLLTLFVTSPKTQTNTVTKTGLRLRAY